MFSIMESGILVKAFGLMETLARTSDGMSLADLADRNSLAKPTAHRVLQCLMTIGYVEKADGAVYRLTGKLRTLVLGPDDGDLLHAGEAPLRALHEKTGETTNLGVLRGDRVVYLIVQESTHALRRVVEANESDPFYCTAMGRAIVSQLPVDQQSMLLRKARLVKRTSQTVIDSGQLRAILQQAAHDGFVIEKNQTDIGVTCIGAPVLQNNRVIAAVSLSAPTVRFDAATQASWVKLVKQTARRIASSLSSPERVNA